ncbi:MAG: L-seryl-tRNA(Sec) selenium transferase [Firmicutes bacterium]|nr:L-seryl-tRNA(Sec) selenium transferase [Bacillota bacterium]
MSNALKNLPSVDSGFQKKEVRESLSLFPRETGVEIIRQALDMIRKDTIENNTRGATREELEKKVFDKLSSIKDLYLSSRLKPVINATGIILHTNLGRAPVGEDAMLNLKQVSSGYCNLEFDMESGERGDRSFHLEEKLCRLTGAESALVVNNNAAAVYLILNTFARDREVVVSRGELIEIGGSFRLPEIIKESGARLVEVGTTNRTYIKDYQQVINENTAVLLRTHPSNYKITGFVHRVSPEELVSLAQSTNTIAVEDLGNGLLVKIGKYGLPEEPDVKEVVASGMDIVCFSGDKILGGAQAGIIVGRKDLIKTMSRNPLMRALRVDKLIISVLETTLYHYLIGDYEEKVPAFKLLSTSLEELKRKAKKLAEAVGKIIGDRGEAGVEKGVSYLGGGTTPAEGLETWLVTIKPFRISEDDLNRKLRQGDPPVIARIENGKVVLDTRTLLKGDIEKIVKFFERLM